MEQKIPAKNFLHEGTMGDVIAAIPAISEFYRKKGTKVNLYLVNGTTPIYYEGATHPTVDKEGNMVMLNEQMIDMLVPLLEAQECIEYAGVWSGQTIHVNLNKIRDHAKGINLPNGCISRWYFYVFPQMACDLSKVWLTVPETDKDFAKGKIIVSRTERYLNPNIHYRFLKQYENDILFAGTELEHIIFNARFGLNTQRLQINNFLELAQAVNQCRFHISNQTMCFQLSQGLKKPRILEVCSYAQNVYPIGEDAYDFYGQLALEDYVKRLAEKYK